MREKEKMKKNTFQTKQNRTEIVRFDQVQFFSLSLRRDRFYKVRYQRNSKTTTQHVLNSEIRDQKIKRKSTLMFIVDMK